MAGFHLYFSSQIYYRLFFLIYPLELIIHLSRVHPNALKIAAITGSRQNSTLLTAQPGANQMSSFARHNSQPTRSSCFITCLLPFSGHCFHSEFIWIFCCFRIFSFALSCCRHTCLKYFVWFAIHLINYLVNSIKSITSF